jgi:antitoxin CptB
MSPAQPVRDFGFEMKRMSGTALSSEGLDERRRRLLYRAWHRGTREMDLIMGRFTDAVLNELTDAELGDYERLMQAPDPDLYAWVTGERAAPPEMDTGVFRRFRDFYQG